MHSPAFATERETTMEYTLPGTNVVIPKGAIITISIGGIHKDPKYYPEPEKFNPENFSPENKAKRHPYTWSPFGQGPRNCIGNHESININFFTMYNLRKIFISFLTAMRFALLEAKAAIAHLVRSFKLEPCQKTDIPFKQSSKTTAKKPANGMWLKFTPRNIGNGQVGAAKS